MTSEQLAKPFNKGFSITQKVSLLAGTIAALASLVVGTLIVNGSVEIVHENALNRLQYETHIKSIRLISDVASLSGDAQYLAGTPPITGIPRAIKNNGVDPLDGSKLETWQRRLQTIFTELIRAKPHYLQIRYIGIADEGRELIRVERKGNTIASISERALQKKGHTEYFENAITANPGEVYLSQLSLNRDHGEISKPYTPMLRAATPIFFEDQLFGILVINMSFKKILFDMVKNTPKELLPYVTNEEGFFLAHPDENMTFGFDLGHEHRIQNLYPDLDFNKSRDLRDSEITITSNNYVLHVIKAKYDPQNMNRFLAVMLATSYTHLESSADNLRLQSIGIMILLVIISLILASVLTTRLMKPLSLISKASDDLAHGRDIKNLPLTSHDEIGELARSFDQMRHQLEDKEQQLILSQSRTHHANKMASLGEMASGMAHEINTPIQTINLIAQRVQRQLNKDVATEDIDDSMNKISDSVKKITSIIDSLRKVSRSTDEQDFSDHKIQEIVDDAINITIERFKVNNIDFKVDFHDISPETLIHCQGIQISQVIINLINNANDAVQNLDKKWIRVDITKAADVLQIAVTDSGLTQSIKNQDKLFEPMYTTKDIGKGTGLGLNISREIINSHKGKLFLDQHSVNTCFVIQLPN